MYPAITSSPTPPAGLAPTPTQWIQVVLGDIDEFIQDHAECERKAMASAMALISRFPDKTFLVEPMIAIAKEELHHYHQVYSILKKRGLNLRAAKIDPYAKALRKLARHSEWHHFIDRLLISALIEARSSERLRIFGDAVEEQGLRKFYQNLAKIEEAHWQVFYNISKAYDEAETKTRWETLVLAEAEIMSSIPIAPRVH